MASDEATGEGELGDAVSDSTRGFFSRFVSSAFSEVHIVSKIQCCILFVTYLLSLLIGQWLTDLFALVPAKFVDFRLLTFRLLFSFHAWALVTFSMVEQHLFSLILDVLVILLTSRLVFSVWSIGRVLLSMLVVSLLVGCTMLSWTFFIYISLYNGVVALDFVYSMFWNYPYSGFVSVSGLLVVLLKQHLPDYILFHPSLRGKHAPGLLFLLVCLVSLPLAHWEQPFLYLLSVFYSWFYLRFFAKSGVEGLTGVDVPRGDRRDAFAFVTLFPMFLRPVVEPFALVCYRVCLFLRMVPRVVEVSSSEESGHDSSILRQLQIEIPISSRSEPYANGLSEAELEIEKRLSEKKTRLTGSDSRSSLSESEIVQGGTPSKDGDFPQQFATPIRGRDQPKDDAPENSPSTKTGE